MTPFDKTTRIVMAISLSILLASCQAGEESSGLNEAGSTRGIVLVTIDTLRADRLAMLGGPVATPALEALAEHGVLFENAISPAPFTLPAHSSIFTGLYPRSHGVVENVGYRLPTEIPTLAEGLRQAGYRTGAFVSAFVLDRRFGLGRGFDHYFDGFLTDDLDAGNLASAQRPGSETVTEAIAWVQQLPDDAPFFCWVHLFEPHDPYEPPEPFRSRFPDDPYSGEIAAADALVGRLVATLDHRAPSWVVAGDHGESLGNHGEAFHGFFIYDATVRVPLILSGDGTGPPGRRSTRPVSLVDLYPTIAGLAGWRPAAGLAGETSSRGKDLLAPESESPTPGPVFSQSSWPRSRYGFSALEAIRVGPWKYIEAPRPELYNLDDDPLEQQDLALAAPDRARDLRRRLARWSQEQHRAAEALATTAATLDSQELAALQSLGYVGGADVGTTPNAGSRDPKDGIELHRKIMELESRSPSRDPVELAEQLRATALIEPGVVAVHQLLGQAELRLDRFDAAARSFRRTLELSPNQPAAAFGLAMAFAGQGELDRARLGLEHLVASDPEDRGSVLALAEIWIQLNQPEKAERVLRRAITRAPRAPALIARLGDLLSSRDPSAAASWYRDALEIDPRAAEVRLRLAAALESMGELEPALEQTRKAASSEPHSAPVWLELARREGLVGRVEEQGRLLAELAGRFPTSARTRIFLAKWLMDHRPRELPRAEDLARQGLELSPEPDPLAHFVLADILNRQGRREEAAQQARRGRDASVATGRTDAGR